MSKISIETEQTSINIHNYWKMEVAFSHRHVKMNY